MPKANNAQTNFTSGEVSPLLRGRVDSAKYANGAEEMLNFVVLPQGGAFRRPGTLMIGEVQDSDYVHRLVPFEFSEAQSYILEFGENTLRIWFNDSLVDGDPVFRVQGIVNNAGNFQIVSAAHGYSTGNQVFISDAEGIAINGLWTITVVDVNNFVLNGSTYAAGWTTGTGWGYRIGDTIVLETPYAGSDLAELQWNQSADTLWLTHPDYQTRVLKRFGSNSWALSVYETTDGPYLSSGSEIISSQVIHVELSGGLITVYLSGPHRLTTGNFVDVSDVQGAVEANGHWEIIESTPNSIKLVGGLAVSAYTGGGIVTAKARIRAANPTDTANVVSSSAAQPNFVAGDVGDHLELPFENDWVLAKILTVDALDSTKATVDLLTNVIKKVPRRTSIVSKQDQIETPKVSGFVADLASVQARAAANLGDVIGINVNYSGVFNNDDVFKFVRKTATGIAEGLGGLVSAATRWGPVTDGLTSENWWKILSISSSSTLTGSHITNAAPYGLGAANIKDWTAAGIIIQIYNRVRTARLYSDMHLFQSTDVGRHIRLNYTGTWVWGKITAINDVRSPFSNYADVEVFSDLPLDRTNPDILANNGICDSFRLGAWSDTTGWPHASTFHEQRLTFAATDTEPQTIWMSSTADFPNFSPSEPSGTVVDDNAITYSLASKEINAINWLHSGAVLLIGTVGGEWQVRSSASFQEPLSPSNITVTPQTSIGSVVNDRGVRVGNGILFIQRSGTKLYDLLYSFELDSWQATDITIISEHILQKSRTDKAVEVVYQKQPYDIVWVRTATGQLAGMTFDRSQEVAAWHFHEIGLRAGGSGGTGEPGVDYAFGNSSFLAGNVESIAVIPDPSGKQEILYMIVALTSGRYLCRLDSFHRAHNVTDKSGIMHLDLAKEFTVSPPSSSPTLTGLAHLNSQDVWYYAFSSATGAHYTGIGTVSGGSITLSLPATVTNVAVGLNYVSRIKTLPLEGGSPFGTAHGKSKRIPRFSARLFQSLDFKSGGVLGDYETTVPNGINLFSGDIRLQRRGSHDLESLIYLVSDDALPLTVLAVWPEQTTNE